MFIAVIIPIHFENKIRKDLTRISIQRLSRQTIPVSVILVGSTEEERAFAQDMKCFYAHQRNVPLSKKYQAGVYYARRLYPEAIMILDSDTWVSDDWCETAITTMQDQQFDGIGMSRFFVLNLDTWEIRKQTYQGTKVYLPLGTGRLFLARSLHRIDWRIFPDGISSKNLDMASLMHCTRAGLHIRAFHTQTNPHLLELRSSAWTSIHEWEDLTKISSLIPYQQQTILNGKSWVQQWFPGGVESLEKFYGLHDHIS